MNEILSRDQNRITVLGGVTDDSNQFIKMFRIDPVTKRVLISAIFSVSLEQLSDVTITNPTNGQVLTYENGVWVNMNASSGSGTVTTVSVVSANGFTGTVANATSTPAITLTTSITAPVLSGNGTAILAATTTGSGSTVVLAASPTMTSPTVGTQATTDNSTLAASTAYVTTAVANAIAGNNPAIAVSAATTAAGNTSAWTYNNGVSGIGATFTGPVNTAITIDGITFTSLTQSLLVKNDTQSPSGAFNGIYNLTALQTVGTGAIFTRRLDYDTPSDINNVGAIPVVGGTINAATSWLQTSNIVTVGTTPLVFIQFSYSPTTIISPSLGGTGIANNAASTVTISGNFATTLTVSNTTALTLPTTGTLAISSAAQTFTGTQTFAQVITTANAITATSNAATIPVTSRHNIVTNNSAATLTITLTTTSAVNMQTCVVQILDASAVAQTLTLVNTENSTVTPPASTNGSTTLPLTLGFIFNSATTKWRLIASA